MFKSQNDESMAVLSLAIDDDNNKNNNEWSEEVLFLLRFNLSVAYPQHKNIKQNKNKNWVNFPIFLYIYIVSLFLINIYRQNKKDFNRRTIITDQGYSDKMAKDFF